MRERKYIKFRVDMLSDTKSKIIDKKPERDLINYVWMALVLLAGKVNMRGELYLSKNIPYTIETLALEFNREIEQVKMAFEILKELEMIEVTKENIYVVKNFAKHQNIKVKENNDVKDKVENTAQIPFKENTEVKEVEEIKKEVLIKENLKNRVDNEKTIKPENEVRVKEEESAKNNKLDNLQVANENIKLYSEIRYDEKDKTSKENIPIILEKKKNKRLNNKKKKENDIDCFDGEADENEMICFYDEEVPLKEGEAIIKSWKFT